MVNKYYAMTVEQREASIYIFGDITSCPFFESDVSSFSLSKELEGLDVDVIHVYINSYGGEVAEGWAIYNMLVAHKAKVITYVTGFACSIASVIFMAGAERVMYDASMLMIHNAWAFTAGNADDLRKEADTLESLSKVSASSYRSKVTISDEELDVLLEEETWIDPASALEKGFATSIVSQKVSKNAAQSARKALFSLIKNAANKNHVEQEPEEKPEPVQKKFFNFKEEKTQ